MTREEAIAELREDKALYESDICHAGDGTPDGRPLQAIDMAIEALKAEPIRCGECKHQDECEEVVLFDVNDDEVIGHRLHWCSYGERKGGEDE